MNKNIVDYLNYCKQAELTPLEQIKYHMIIKYMMNLETASSFLERIPTTSAEDALLWSCKENNTEFLNLFFSANIGFDINTQDETGFTALHYACYNKNTNLVGYLLQTHRPNVKKTDTEGRTPLHIACGLGLEGIYSLLVKHSSDINIPDDFGNTPFHYAANKGSISLMGDLIYRKADMNHQNEVGCTPAHYACLNQDSSNATYLMWWGAKSIKDNMGHTARYYLNNNFTNTSIEQRDTNSLFNFSAYIVSSLPIVLLFMIIPGSMVLFTLCVESIKLCCNSQNNISDYTNKWRDYVSSRDSNTKDASYTLRAVQ